MTAACRPKDFRSSVPSALGRDGRLSDGSPMWTRGVMLICAMVMLGSARAPSRVVVWAWERPEDLRFVGDAADVAIQSGFIVLSGDGVQARGRRFPLRMSGRPTTALVHIQIDRGRPLAWTLTQRREAAQAVLAFGQAVGADRLQVDFEVRRSERGALLDLLSDVRRGLPKEKRLSMTALASWCETETWLNAAPVDEIAPMLFRLGPGGQRLKAKLAAGGDFANPRCRSALAVSTDAPLARAPHDGRRVYLFDPQSWTEPDYAALRKETARW